MVLKVRFVILSASEYWLPMPARLRPFTFCIFQGRIFFCFFILLWKLVLYMVYYKYPKKHHGKSF